MRLVHVLVPRARDEDLLHRQTLEQPGVVDRMRVDRGAEQDRILPNDLIEHARLADDAGELVRRLARVAVVVDAVGQAEPVEPGTQIEKDALLPAGPRRAADDAADNATRIAIEGQPAIALRLLVEQVEDHQCQVISQMPPAARGAPNPKRCASRSRSGSPNSPWHSMQSASTQSSQSQSFDSSAASCPSMSILRRPMRSHPNCRCSVGTLTAATSIRPSSPRLGAGEMRWP